MGEYTSASTVPASRVRAGSFRASGHDQRGYCISIASIAVGVAGLLAVLVAGMVAYLGLAISLDHR